MILVNLNCPYCNSGWMAFATTATRAALLEMDFRDIHSTCQEVEHYE